MVVKIPSVLNAEQLAQARDALATAEWTDGRATAGHQSARAKNNMQLPENSPVARKLGETIVAALERHPLFLAAALPHKIFPPLFNRYEGGQNFGSHVDNAVRQVPGTPFRVRTDLSATLFLSDPSSYDGGELCIEDAHGVQNIKLPAGDMILYPAGSLHHVKPVTRGARLASFFWLQSMVRADHRRTILLDLDLAIQSLKDHPSAVPLTGVYHNLLREWAEI
jgi:PKHD-type hydroxylase